MVSISDIRQWKADTLEDARNQYKKALDTLTGEGDEFAGLKITGADWDGEAAAKSMAAHGRLVQQGDRYAAGLAAIVKGLEQAADAVKPLPRQINEAEELGRKYGFKVGDNGEVTDQFAGKKPPPDMHPEDRARAKTEITTKLQQVVRTATDIDADLAGVFSEAGSGGFGGGQAGFLSTAAAVGSQAMALTTPDPPKDGTPAQNAAWWATLSKAEKDAAVHDPVNKIGNLNGVPAAARSAANMNALPKVKAGLQHKLDELRRELKNSPVGGDYQTRTVNSQNIDDLKEQIRGVEGKISALDKIGQTVDQSAGQPEGSRYYLLGVDGSGSGKAILAKGNPDTAKNVATFVPGTGSNLAGLPDGAKTKADAMWKAAHRSGAKTSVISWQGYDAPPTLGDAAHESWADNGKGAFDQFQQGLRASHHGAPSHNVAVGHSYGTTLIGHAARDGNVASDALVFAGSPGVGVDHANQLNVPHDHVYATEAQHDIIRLSNAQVSTAPNDPGSDLILGPDPTNPDFGGHEFAANPGTPGDWYTGGYSADAHREYWDQNNPSLANMGYIINGQPPNAH